MIKTHRVGSVTFGSILIVLGVLLTLHVFVPALTYANIMQFWPVTFIVLGCEVLFANIRSEKVAFRYDGWSIFFLFSVLIFAGCMGVLDYYLINWPEYVGW